MSGLRNNAPLLDAYLSYFEEHHISFTIPGHKHKASLLDEGLGRVVDSDLPLFGGLDEAGVAHDGLQNHRGDVGRLQERLHAGQVVVSSDQCAAGGTLRNSWRHA